MIEIRTPRFRSRVVELARGGRWRKQVLPRGRFNVRGKTLDLSDTYLRQVQDAFRAGAFDDVPAVLADAGNRHTLDPTRVRGSVVDMELDSDGLFAVMELSADAAELVKQHPRMGVSLRLMEGYQRADGQSFPVACQHVLLTTDPVMTGMAPWAELEPVELSRHGSSILDLSNAGFPARRTGPTAAEFMTAMGLPY